MYQWGLPAENADNYTPPLSLQEEINARLQSILNIDQKKVEKQSLPGIKHVSVEDAIKELLALQHSFSAVDYPTA
jgi:hypothetical protein